MKTTIDFPEQLLHQAKIVAAQRRTTLKELIIQGLSYSLRNPESEPDRRSKLTAILQRMQAGNHEPMVPLTREEIYDR